MYFSNTPSLRCCEIMMVQIPGFGQKGGGTYRSPHKYKKEDCDCTLCPNYSRKENACSEIVCPILNIRIDCGAAYFHEAVSAAFRAVKNPALRERLNQYINNIKDGDFMIYRGKVHQKIFEEKMTWCDGKGIIGNRFVAVLYLLSADHFLWSKMQHNIGINKIRFDGVSLGGISPDSYAIWKAAKELYLKEKQLTFSELADRDIVSDETFRLIIQAITIGRHGYAVTKLKGGKKA